MAPLTTNTLSLCVALLATLAAAHLQKRQVYSQRPSPQAYYKRPAQPQESYYQTPPPQQVAYRPQAYQPAPQVYQPLPQAGAAYYQPAVPPQYSPKPKPKGQDLSKIPGTPGVDYPTYHSVPDTSFSCGNVPATPGIYANVETGCQAYHVCHDGREGHQGASFLCTNGTLFNQHDFACDWWYNVNCADAPQLYSLNLDPVKNPYAPKPKKEEELAIGPDYYQP